MSHSSTDLGRTAQTNTFIDLLNAAAHDPELNYDSDSDDEIESSAGPSTPISASADDASLGLPHEFDSSKAGADGPSPVRGASLYMQGKKADAVARNLAQEITLDRIDDVDASILRAQKDAKNDDDFDDPEAEDVDQPTLRLATLTQEFGEWTGPGKEDFISQMPGALYRGVLIKGLLALTTKRVFFYAFVPPREANKVIRSGPVTVHMGGRFTRTRRVWVELRTDSCTWYKSSATLYSPIGSCRLSGVKAVHELDPDNPRQYTISLVDGRTRTFELDTVESAIAWHGDVEAALFTFRTSADRLRMALPLQLITKTSIAPYMTLAERVSVEFDPLPHGSSTGTASATSSMDEGSDDSKSSQTVEFGYLKSHETFSGLFLDAIDNAHKETEPCAVEPVLEFDSPVPPEEAERLEEIKADKGLAAAFCTTFALADKPSELHVWAHVELVRSLPTWGSIAISSVYICFWQRKLLAMDVKMRIPLVDIDDVGPCRAFGFRIFGLSIQVHGAPDVRLDFKHKKDRDQVVEHLRDVVLNLKAASVAITNSVVTSSVVAPTPSVAVAFDGPPTESPAQMTPSPGSPPLRGMSLQTPSTTSTVTSSDSASTGYVMPPPPRPIFGGTRSAVLGQSLVENITLPGGQPVMPMPRVIGAIGQKRVSGLHFVCMTIGSRGDVQPYIALGKELMRDGNKVTIASHPEYRDWVESYGIGYREVGGDPAALMKLSVEHKMFSPGFFRESLGHFRQWLDDLFLESWHACQEADVLIESPSGMAGIHVAEALGIPYFRAFTMPWTATSTYPQAFAASVELGPTYNSLSYTLFDSVMWKATSGQVNRWRKNVLGLKSTNMHKLSAAKTPFIYNFSSAVVPKPLDWRDNIYISGYWFLDNPDQAWDPPAGLLDFIQKARDDGKKVVYIGFGSIVVSDSAAVTRAVANAVVNSDVRAILSKGWSDRGSTKVDDFVLPPEIFSVPSIAHDRLFPLIDAAMHHGGAGTTGASLRAGLPTLIHPFFGDQFFWASRVRKSGAGLQVDSLGEKDLTEALKKGTQDRIMKEKAEAVGEKIRLENGPRAALDFIYEHIHLAQQRADIRRARAEGDSRAGRPSPHSQHSGEQKSATAGLSRNKTLTKTLANLCEPVLTSSSRSSSPSGRSPTSVVANAVKRVSVLPGKVFGSVAAGMGTDPAEAEAVGAEEEKKEADGAIWG